ncbi:MAG: DUF885 domain-containing protein [Actinomycetota bacterium]
MASIFELSDRAVDAIADQNPLAATYLGLPGRDHRWPDLSPAGHDVTRQLWAGLLAEAEATEPADAAEDLAKRVLIADARDSLARHDAGDHLRDLNNITSTFQSLKSAFDLMPRDSKDDWSRIIVRLETIDWPIDGYIETLQRGLDQGMAVARRQVEAAIREGRVTEGDDSPFVGLQAAFAEKNFGDDGMTERVGQAVATATAAYGRLTDWLEATYLPLAAESDACGAERYVMEARKHLGMDIDIGSTYAWGWSEVDRIHARMLEIAAEIDPDKTLSEVIAGLATDPERGIDDADAFIDRMQQVQNEAMEQLAGVHFDVPDEIRDVDVKPAPAGGSLAPFYTGPSEDFSRNGAVWYPLGSRTFFPLWDEMTTAYHEGFPGHHLQVGVQTALGDQLSRYHRIAVWQPGSGEGWALYAERLMGELGFHDRPEYELGMLSAEMLRAARIVIDIGLHCELPIPADAMFHPGETWTWELAVEMLRDVSFQNQEMSESEATRYLGWPGQAISYKIGQQVILDLRDELSEREDFDLKAFHTDVLSVGSIGLDLLKELVRAA